MTGAYSTTTVQVEKSQSEVRNLLTSHGATRFAFGEETDAAGVRWAMVQFGHSGLMVRMRVPHKPVERNAVSSRYNRSRSKTWDQIEQEMAEQEARRIWRVIAWNLKARLVAVDEGVETFAEAFLAHLLDPETNRTIYESLTDTGAVDLGRPLAGLLEPPR
jgi:hypothetical protein